MGMEDLPCPPPPSFNVSREEASRKRTPFERREAHLCAYRGAPLSGATSRTMFQYEGPVRWLLYRSFHGWVLSQVRSCELRSPDHASQVLRAEREAASGSP